VKEQRRRDGFPHWLGTRWYYIGVPLALFALLVFFTGWRSAYTTWGSVLIVGIFLELFVMPWFRKQVNGSDD
jgi:hypothetical protein